MTMAKKQAKKPQRATIAGCANCRRTHLLMGKSGQLRRENALKCPTCKAPLQVTMEVECW
jgi:hypothetical protein